MLAVTPILLAADDDTNEEARLKYESAFAEKLKLPKRVEILESVVKDYADTQWGDDALWVLAEVAAKGGYRKKAIQFREKLLARDTAARLEHFTQAQAIYKDSRVPVVEYLLKCTGRLYARKGKKVIVFNPVPMLTAEELAFDYERTKKPEKALKTYRIALAASPPESLFAGIYTRRIKQLEKTVAALKKLREKTGPAEPDKPKTKADDTKEEERPPEPPPEKKDEKEEKK